MNQIRFLNLLGPAGSGKSTLKKLLLTYPGFTSYVPVTTRKKRHNEVGGVDYWFISVEEYLADKTLIIKRVVDSRTMYGVKRSDIESLPADKIIVTTMDANGISSLEQLGYDVLVISLVFSEQVRIRRMIKRGDSIHDIYKRLQYDRKHHTNSGFSSTLITISDGNPTEIKNRIIQIIEKL